MMRLGRNNLLLNISIASNIWRLLGFIALSKACRSTSATWSLNVSISLSSARARLTDCEIFICNWRILLPLPSCNRLCCTKPRDNDRLERGLPPPSTPTNLGEVRLERFQRFHLVRNGVFDEVLDRQVQIANSLFRRPHARRLGHDDRRFRRGLLSYHRRWQLHRHDTQTGRPVSPETANDDDDDNNNNGRWAAEPPPSRVRSVGRPIDNLAWYPPRGTFNA